MMPAREQTLEANAIFDANRIIAIGGPTGVGLTTSGGSGMPVIIVSNEPIPGENVVLSFDLEQNYPNPFSRETTFAYSLDEPTRVVLSVYDLLGREVERLVDESRPAGRHETQFRPSGLASGVYLARIQIGDTSKTRRIMHVR